MASLIWAMHAISFPSYTLSFSGHLYPVSLYMVRGSAFDLLSWCRMLRAIIIAMYTPLPVEKDV